LAEDPRFEFGQNWLNFVESVDESQLVDAKAALRRLLNVETLENESFLDAGCGSGIVSLAALDLNAKAVHSFDYDQNSVAATQSLINEKNATENWTVEQGSLTDSKYLTKLGNFDTVYSWGVIHHTGAMWQVAEALPGLVKPGGRLVIAIYNDQGPISTIWRGIKKTYVKSPTLIQSLIALAYFAPTLAVGTLKNIVTKRQLRRKRPRGMSAWHDAVDWVGGYPFEVASREEVIAFFEAKGLSTENVISVGSKQGCNQFVFRAQA
jgi:2-polyprenyl-6-hydroxyphenyl methylase/3-demethylubiquinone-9 3-methyltransferase